MSCEDRSHPDGLSSVRSRLENVAARAGTIERKRFPRHARPVRMDSGLRCSRCLTKYCTGCHGPTKPKGGLNLAAFQDESLGPITAQDVGAGSRIRRGGRHAARGSSPADCAKKSASLIQWIKLAIKPEECGRTFDPGPRDDPPAQPHRI